MQASKYRNLLVWKLMRNRVSNFKKQILSNSAFVLLSTISVGAPSVLVLYVADFALLQSDFSLFIKVWAITATLTVGATAPLYTYAPILRMNFGEADSEFDYSFFLVSFIIGLVFVLPIQLIFVSWLFEVRTFASLFPIVLFATLSISFNVKNSLLIAKGSYALYFSSASVFGLIACLSLLLIKIFNGKSISIFFYAFCLAFGLASCDKIVHSIWTFSWNRHHAFVNHIHTMNSSASFLVTVFITSVSTFVLNGPLILGSYIGASDTQLISFGAFLNIGLICFTILNSFTAPVQTALISCWERSEYQRFRSLYRKSFVFYFLFTAFTTICLAFTINFLARLYVPSVEPQSEITLFILIAGFGFSTMLVLPRLGLMISDQYRGLIKIWLVGLATFLVGIFVPIDPFGAMVFAPTLSSGLMLIACHLSFNVRFSQVL
jgi:O-antigen/teichoic acid export membrane protein